MNSETCRTLGALWAVGGGVLTALVPELSVMVYKRMLGKQFENVAELDAKPAYLRQLRAVGVGFAAAGIANLLMDRAASDAED